MSKIDDNPFNRRYALLMGNRGTANLLVSYDSKADVLYITFDKVQLCISEEVGDTGVFIRHTKAGNAPVGRLNGVTITNFSKIAKEEK